MSSSVVLTLEYPLERDHVLWTGQATFILKTRSPAVRTIGTEQIVESMTSKSPRLLPGSLA